uniref:Uncharacterized protein n=1 Tax=viral metagenome TaxID=1070528 RepID=A0A6C0F4I6_9ZZZZ
MDVITTLPARFPSAPRISFVNDDGSMYVMMADGDRTISLLSRDGILTPFAGAPNPRGDHEDGPVATAKFENPYAIAKGPDGALYVADEYCIRVIRDGQVSTLAGHEYSPEDESTPIDGVGAGATIVSAEDIWFDEGGRLLFWDEDTCRSVAMDGTVTTVAEANYGDAGWDAAWELRHTNQAVDKEGNRFYSGRWAANVMMGNPRARTAIVKKTPAGVEQMYGRRMVDDYSPARDGPISEAIFHMAYTFAYDSVQDIMYFTDLNSIRKIEFPRPQTAQLMGEQVSRQTPLIPDVMKTISAFTGATDPNRVYQDAVKNRGVALPRQGGRRRTHRKKANRKKKMTRKRRSTSS